jgi:hypothetical protein
MAKTHYKFRLFLAQNSFASFGVCGEAGVSHVRAPLPDEPRSADWVPIQRILDAERTLLLGRLESAFADVRLGHGTSLEEAEMLDDYKPLPEPRPIRDYVSWSDVEDKKLAKFGAFPFLDSLGMRYYFPAFMHWYLRSIEEQGRGANAYDQVISALSTHEPRKEPFDLFSNEQRCCILAFLEFVVKYEEDHVAERRIRVWRAACDRKSD